MRQLAPDASADAGYDGHAAGEIEMFHGTSLQDEPAQN
jgi:hypothetical protein